MNSNQPDSKKATVFSELKRRKVVRVAGGYLLVSWVLLQVAGALEDALELPGSFDGYVVAILAIGFPIAVVVAWIYDLNKKGISRTPALSGASEALPKLAFPFLLMLSLLGGGGIAAYWFLTSEERSFESEVLTTDVDSIAVLPLTNLSPNPEQDHLGIAISDELRNVLSRVQGIRVASRPSSLRFAGDDRVDTPTIASELGVSHILEGSLQQVADTLRVSVQLVNAMDDTQVFSRAFDLPFSVDNILSIQDEIATEAVTSLGRDLNHSAQQALSFMAASGTDNLDAYEAYLQARELFITRNQATDPEDFQKITDRLESATRMDPEFGHAWAALAMQHYTSISWGGDPVVQTEKARQAAQRALELNENLALAHAVLGVTSTLPDGRIDRIAAIDGLTRAIDLNPVEPTLRSWRGQHWIELGFFERGIQDLEETTALTVQNGVANFWMINAGFLNGDIEMARGRIPDWSRDNPRLRILEAIALAKTGNQQDISSALLDGMANDRILQEVASALTEESYDYDSGYARVVEMARDNEARTRLVERPLVLYVFKQYDRLPVEPPLSGRLTWWFSAHEDFLNSKRRHEYFHELGLSDYWLEIEFPAQCTPDESVYGFSCN